jgi:hypothetical protein
MSTFFQILALLVSIFVLCWLFVLDESWRLQQLDALRAGHTEVSEGLLQAIREFCRSVGNVTRTIVLLGLIVVTVSLWTAASIDYYSAQVTEAQGFCESIIPKLEAAHVQTGYYPTNLDVTLLPAQALPALLKGRAFYKSDGRRYSFTFYEPLAWDNIWEYTSREMRWLNYD